MGRCDTCTHVGMETMSDVAECNVCENGSGYAPDEMMVPFRFQYNPPDMDLIKCPSFGKTGSLNSECARCNANTPYHWEMCCDESLKSSLMRLDSEKAEEDIIRYINQFKSKSKI